jgi:Trypsin-like peptidase domain/Effector-associated domain 1
MQGIDLEKVRDVITDTFDLDDLDQLLRFKFDVKRANIAKDDALDVVVFKVLQVAERQGWEAQLIAEVAAERPMRPDVQEVYRQYAEALVGEVKQRRIDEKVLAAYQRFGLAPPVNVQRAGVGVKETPPSDAGLEKAIKESLGYLDVGLWREQLFQLEGRVCRVEVGDGSMGTGFLVGPDVLLTNYHVLQAVIEGTSDAAKVRLRFDYKVLANKRPSDGVLVSLHASDWRVDDSPYTPSEKAARPDEALPTADQLDYALVRLDRSFGDAPINPKVAESPKRGWVRVPTAAPAISPKMPVLILQHPKRTPLKLALDTEGVIAINANGTRVRYATNTEEGSSGSPCFDKDWTLLALHHYGDPAFNHPPEYNQGIPIGAIRNRLERLGKTSLLGGDPGAVT